MAETPAADTETAAAGRERSKYPLIRAFDGAVSGLNAVGTVWIFVIMVLINTDVFSRYLFNQPITGVPLIIEHSIIAIVFLQLAAALRGGRMTRSDVMIARLLAMRPSLGFTLQAIYHFAGVVLMILIVGYTWPFLEKTWIRNTFAGLEGDFTIPVWPFKALIMVGAAACAVQYVRHFAADIRVLKDRAAELSHGAGVAVGLGSAAAVAAIFLVLGLVLDLSAVQVGLISILFVLFLVYVGVHIGIALALLSFVCVWIIRGSIDDAGKLLALAASESLARYEFGVIPLFILMGLLVSISDIGRDTYDVANHLFRKVRAGLGMATVGANAVFAAVTGTTIASASVFTKVAVPEMLRLGYKPRFAVGVVAGSSVLGMLIPPSLLLILFGILAETSIGDLFIAGIVPGLLLTAAYCLLIWFLAARFPDKVATPEALNRSLETDMSAGEAAAKGLPIVLLIVVVLGGIYGGVFTATEAGAVGALGALVLTAVKRRLTWRAMWEALSETGHVTAAICFLLISAHVYSRMIALTGIPNEMDAFIAESGLGFAGLIGLYIVLLVILGTILDSGSIMLITVPLIVPPMMTMGVDLIWLGIVTVIGVEIGLLTPPLGIAVFVVHNNLQDGRISVNDVFWGAAPFALTMLAVLILVTVFPQIALVLL